LIYLTAIKNIDCIKKDISNKLRELFNYLFYFWLNGCLDNRCEFSVVNASYSVADIGISFLSVLSLFYPVKYVVVYDIINLARYRIGFHDIKITDVLSFIPSTKELSLLGLQILSDHWVKPIVNTDKMVDEVIWQLKKLVVDSSVLEQLHKNLRSLRCNEELIRISRRNGLVKATILYRCLEPGDYEKLVRIIYLYRFLAGKIHGPNTIVKVVWKTNKPAEKGVG